MQLKLNVANAKFFALKIDDQNLVAKTCVTFQWAWQQSAHDKKLLSSTSVRYSILLDFSGSKVQLYKDSICGCSVIN